jgi:hypothetical protein
MRYFYASEKTASYGGWSEIEYIGFPSVGHGTIYNKDGSTKSFDENLAWALRAVETGGWVEVFPVDPAVAKANENAARIDLDVDPSWLDDLRNGSWDVTVDQDDDRDFLVTATVQIIVRAEDRVIARLIAAETLRDYISDSPYPNDVMNGLTIDDVEDLMEQD